MVGHLVAVVAMQAAMWCLARMLRCPLRACAVAAGLLLPYLVLAPLARGMLPFGRRELFFTPPTAVAALVSARRRKYLRT